MNSLKILLSGLLLAGLAFSLPATAQSGSGNVEVLSINMGNQVYQRNSVIRLKQEILKAYPRKNLNRANLQRVTIYAKSRAGHGSVELQIDQRPMDRKSIGDSRNFASNAIRTFDTVVLNAIGKEDRGNWQLILNGNIKVNRIEVRIRHNAGGGNTPPPPPPVTSSWEVVGQGNAGYFVAGNQSFNVGVRNVEAIRIDSRGSIFMQIPQVWVEFANGQTRRLPQLEGDYTPQSRSKQITINDRNIRKIWVSSFSFGFGAAASYTVSVKTSR